MELFNERTVVLLPQRLGQPLWKLRCIHFEVRKLRFPHPGSVVVVVVVAAAFGGQTEIMETISSQLPPGHRKCVLTLDLHTPIAV